MKKYLQIFVLGASLMTASSWAAAADSRAALPDQTLVKAENTSLNFRHAPAPANLVEELRKGGM